MESSGWLPIETAPKDERSTILLGHFDGYEAAGDAYEVTAGFWGQLDGHAEDADAPHAWCDWTRGLDEDDFWTEVEKPTHWMPLPPPPHERIG